MKDHLVNINHQEEIVTLDDGFKYYWPVGCTQGAFSAVVLRDIADQLDEMNEEWQLIIDSQPIGA